MILYKCEFSILKDRIFNPLASVFFQGSRCPEMVEIVSREALAHYQTLLS